MDMRLYRPEYSKRVPKSLRRARKLRRRETLAEKILWGELKDRRCHSLKFKRQVPIGPFIADFFCSERRLIIEVDGAVHQFTVARDRWRQRFLERGSFTVLRFTNDEVFYQLQEVLLRISQTHNKHPLSPPRGEGWGEGVHGEKPKSDS